MFKVCFALQGLSAESAKTNVHLAREHEAFEDLSKSKDVKTGRNQKKPAASLKTLSDDKNGNLENVKTEKLL